ncbi:MAG: copper resistance protein B [Oleispira sp.]|nr:copper resistance protein B [Oleispira sp.]
MLNINFLLKAIALTGVTSGLVLTSSYSLAAKGADPILSKVMINQLEIRDIEGEDNDSDIETVLEGQAWMGKDLNKFWLKLESEYINKDEYETELQLLYSKAIAPYWDLQIGARSDIGPDDSNNWAVLGLQGLAPYYFETDMAVFVSEEGDVAARVSLEYELLFSQKLILTPEITLDAFAQDNDKTSMGSGLASSDIGLRLRYEITKEFAPYIGISQNNLYGKTQSYAKAAGLDSESTQWVVGIRAWF